MKHLAVQVREVPLAVDTLGGTHLQAHLFLHNYGMNGPERLLERLNSSEPFLPLRPSQGKVQLWRKSALLRLKSLQPLPELEEYETLGVPRAAVQVRLVNGQILDGRLFLLLPSTNGRVSDLLNRPERFLLMESTEGILALNKDGFESVHPIDGDE
jgi:hypothetical protein